MRPRRTSAAAGREDNFPQHVYEECGPWGPQRGGLCTSRRNDRDCPDAFGNRSASKPAAADDEPVPADDDDDDEPTAADELATADLAADAPFPVGAQVEARFQEGEKFYPALVVAVLGDGRRVDLLYCDGDAERGVSVDLVRPLARRRRTPVSAPPPAPLAPATARKKKPKRAKAPVLVAAPAAPVPAVVEPPAGTVTQKRNAKPRPGREAVGRRVRVWWPDDAAWYTGSVVSYDGARHAIKYDDGDEESLDLSREKHEFVTARPLATPQRTHRGAPTRCYAKGSPQNRGARAGATSSSDDDSSSDSSSYTAAMLGCSVLAT